MSGKQHRVSRRQFLNYTLTGVGGFMAASMIMPMARFAVDPILEKRGSSEMIQVVKEDELTTEPQSFNFKVHQVDAWHESEEPKTAWLYKDENGEIVALSPICKHLGCTVNWASDPAHPNQFFCPCHYGRYYKDGKNVPGTPPPVGLDIYDYEVRDGWVYLGKARPRGGA